MGMMIMCFYEFDVAHRLIIAIIVAIIIVATSYCKLIFFFTALPIIC